MIARTLYLLASFAALTSCGPLPVGRCTPLEARCDLIGHDGAVYVQLCASDRTWVDVTRCDGACVSLPEPSCE